VRDRCAAYAAGTQNERPAPRKAGPLPHEDTAVPVIQRAGEVLLVRRPTTARLGGMWAFPQAVRRPDESIPAAAVRAAREGLGMEIQPGEPVAIVQHTFTHVRATYHALRCAVISGDPRALQYDALAWVPWDRIGGYALPVAQKRIAALAAETTLFTG
jgi:adenine-specific DNA glycosylase